MTSIGIGIGDTGPVFTRYLIDTKICSIAHPYFVDRVWKGIIDKRLLSRGGGRLSEV